MSTAPLKLNPSLPKFGGTKAVEIARSLIEIESNFLKQVGKLRVVEYNVLDVKATKWHDDFGAFKNSVKDLEVGTVSSNFHARSFFKWRWCLWLGFW